MEYYAGYLMPAQIDMNTPQKSCKDATKLKKRLKGDIGNLETRIKAIEGKLMLSSNETEKKYKHKDHESRSLNKLKYKVIENEYEDYNAKAEN